jgi:hypothetical protein
MSAPIVGPASGAADAAARWITARTDATASAEQRQLIDYALMIRPLPAGYRGVAPMISGLDGRWAVPGVGYGARIVALAGRMRQA